MTISELCEEAHAIAKSKGFWEVFEDGSVKKRNLSELLMLCVSELGESCEALRRGDLQKDEIWRKDTFEDELADTMIRIGDLAKSEGIDLEWQIEKKLEYNRTREYKHGKIF